MLTVALTTLGCKVNQVDTQQIREQFARLGFVEKKFGEKVDVTVINSCTVTAKADRQSRSLLLRARRASPKGLLVMSGCLIDRGEIGRKKAEGADLLVANEEKDRLAGLVLDRLGIPAEQLTGDRSAERIPKVGFSGRARAYLRVQNGCDQKCAYCLVPAVRGPSRSVSLTEALAQARLLVDSGFNELVLTGIHLGHWGADLTGRPGLADLCRAIEKQARPKRLRLSSIEPGEVTDELLDWLADSPAACSHLHIPLQSGDAQVLKRMNRLYTPDQYRKVIEKIRLRIPAICIGADVLTGFPGETEDEFKRTYDFIRTVKINYLHVFPYSLREETPAAALPDQLPPEILSSRSVKLRELSGALRLKYTKSFLGQKVEMLVETIDRKETEVKSVGTSRNYLKVTVPDVLWEPGELRVVTLVEAKSGTATGRPAAGDNTHPASPGSGEGQE